MPLSRLITVSLLVWEQCVRLLRLHIAGDRKVVQQGTVVCSNATRDQQAKAHGTAFEGIYGCAQAAR
jgi:hypothetical protein